LSGKVVQWRVPGVDVQRFTIRKGGTGVRIVTILRIREYIDPLNPENPVSLSSLRVSRRNSAIATKLDPKTELS
jgi:hypothetical protein